MTPELEICFDCGVKHGTIGFWTGHCNWCGKDGDVTIWREYAYPAAPVKKGPQVIPEEQILPLQIARSICRALFYYDHGMRRLWPKYRYRAEQFCAKAIERDRRETRAAARAEAFEEAAEIAKTYRERYQSQGDAEADIAAVMAEEIEAAIRENAKGE